MEREAAPVGQAVGPLQGVRVVLTRPWRAADQLSGAMQALGAEVVIAPLIETRLLLTQELRDTAGQWSSFDALLFTSATAVRAVAQVLTDIGQPPDAVNVPIYTVGQATAAEAEHRGLSAVRPPDVANAGALAAYVVDQWLGRQPHQVWWPCSRRAIQTLRDTLTEAGHVVTATVCYDTFHATVDAMAWRQYLADPLTYICFHSPSAVASLVQQTDSGLQHSMKARLVCIGDTTGEACKQVGLTIAGVAAAPNDEAMLHKVLQLSRASEVQGPST